MSEFGFIIDGMTWSFSRIEAFHQCPYAWKIKYIDCERGDDNAYGQYGKVCHEILERYFAYELEGKEMVDEFIWKFGIDITEPFPYNKFSNLRQTYYEKGLHYFETFKEEDITFDTFDEIVGVEMKVEFEIDGKPFIGYVDLLLKNEDDEVMIVDHKSASAKFCKNGTPTKELERKLVMYKRQLYLYSKAVIEKGLKPKWLCWNFFNEGKVYKTPFVFEEYQEALEWAANSIKQIESEEYFTPKEEWYYCHNICNYRHKCELVNCGEGANDSQDTGSSE